ncbi:DNA repair protein RecO [bacterium]|nr:DNA repair protein RecO [bacterium]
MNRSDAGENDRRLILLTESQGLVDVVAKGARKAGSRLAGGSEPMVLAEFTWAEGRARSFVQHVKPVTSFPGLRQNYDRMMGGIAWCDSVRSFLPFGAPADEIFALSVRILRTLEEEREVVPVLAWGFARLLMEDGLAPDWLACAVTGEPLAKTPVAFDFAVGGPVENPELASGQVEWVDFEVLVGLMRIGELEEPPLKFRHGVVSLNLLRMMMEYHTDRKCVALRSLISDLRSSG